MFVRPEVVAASIYCRSAFGRCSDGSMHVTVSVTHTGTFYTHTEERLPITNLPNYITCIHPGLKREGSAGNTGKALVVEASSSGLVM